MIGYSDTRLPYIQKRWNEYKTKYLRVFERVLGSWHMALQENDQIVLWHGAEVRT